MRRFLCFIFNRKNPVCGVGCAHRGWLNFIPDPFSNPALAAGVIASGFFMLNNHEIIGR
jgi:hypothetical protein